MATGPTIKRIPFDSLTLQAVVREAQAALLGGRVQHITEPSEFELGLTVHRRGPTAHLLLSIHAHYARAHLIRRRPQSLPVPKPFCMACRKYLEGARILDLRQVGVDRILHIDLQRGEARYALVAEFMGKHSNLILLNEAEIVLSSAKTITERESRVRPVRPGLPYSLPPPPRGVLPLDSVGLPVALTGAEDAPDLRSTLLQQVQGMSPFLADLIASNASVVGLEYAWRDTVGAVLRGELTPVKVRTEAGTAVGAYPVSVSQLPGLHEIRCATLSLALEETYAEILRQEQLESLRGHLLRAVRDAISNRQLQRGIAQQHLSEALDAQRWRRYADLLIAAENDAPVSEDVAWVRDTYAQTAERVGVPLIAGKSVKETAAAYYERARKLDRAQQHLVQRLAAIESELGDLSMFRERLESACTLSDLEALRAEILASGLVRLPASDRERDAGKTAMTRIRGVRAIETPEGYQILVGTNADGNAELLRSAAPDDLWFHVRSGTGAHVVIRTARQPDRVPHSVIHRAACLAARHSSAKHSSYVPVDYTLRKYVRPVRGGTPGRVVYRMHRTEDVNPQECAELGDA